MDEIGKHIIIEGIEYYDKIVSPVPILPNNGKPKVNPLLKNPTLINPKHYYLMPSFQQYIKYRQPDTRFINLNTLLKDLEIRDTKRDSIKYKQKHPMDSI